MNRPGTSSSRPHAVEADASFSASTAAMPTALAQGQGAFWLIPVLLGIVLGSALQLQQPGLWTFGWYAVCMLGAALLSALAWWLRDLQKFAQAGARHAVFAGAIGIAFTLASFGGVGLRAVHYLGSTMSPAWEGKNIELIGVVASLPQAVEQGTRFVMRVESAQLDGNAVALPPLVDLGWYPGGWGGQGDKVTKDQTGESGESDLAAAEAPAPEPAAPRAGERWRLTARLKAPHGARNPHGFDYELRLWELGVQAVGYVRLGRKDPQPLRLDAALRHPVLQLRQHVRDSIFATLRAADPEVPSDSTAQGSAEQVLKAQGATGQGPVEPGTTTQRTSRSAGVVAALVTGDQRAIDRSDWNIYRATGVAHLVSISGLHITLFAWLAAQIVGVLWRRVPRWCLLVPAPTASLIGGLALASFYAVFSGWGVPAQRTILMLAVVFFLRLAGRRWPWPLVWLLACAAVVISDPWALLQAGFWLSFVAVGVLFAIFPVAASAINVSAGGRFLSLLRQQAVITVALAPLTLLLFGQVSVVGFAANLVAIPWVTLVVTPLAFAGLAWAPLWHLADWAVQGLGWWLGLLASLPWAQFEVASAPLWAGLAGVLGGVLLVMRLPLSFRLAGLPLCLPVLLWQAPRPALGAFELLAADIGQGNAVLVRTASHAMLYDTGPRFSSSADAGDRVLVPLLRALGERLDLVMVSHRDNDHSGGASAVLLQQPQAQLTGSIAGEAALLALRAWTPCAAGQRWSWDGVQFEVLHPLVAAPARLAPGERPNAQSCVLRIRSADQTTALLVGDIERPQERALLQRAAVSGESLQADMLLVPHHGSKTSSSDAFLDAAQPRTALVQAAYRSRFGHPAPEVVERYRARGAVVVDTAHCGAATWQSTAPAAVQCERTVHRHYWQHAVP